MGMNATNTAALVDVAVVLAREHVLRCLRSMSAQGLADEIGVSESTVARVARYHKYDMGTRSLKKILSHRDKLAGEMK